MISLQKISTVYVDHEDRIHVAGALLNGDTIVIWLTQRMLRLLIPCLTDWLQKTDTVAGAAAAAADEVQSFRQLAAKASIEHQAPVAATGKSLSWLVSGVDYRFNSHIIHLTFKGRANETAGLDLSLPACRQWLSILYDAYRQANWPMDAWPDWISQAKTQNLDTPIVRH
jgi:hypothetical protein